MTNAPQISIASIGECMVELVPSRQNVGLYERNFAGDTLNFSVYLARLLTGTGAHVYYVTRLGDDALSNRMIVEWQSEGLDSSLVRQVDGRLPGLYLVERGAQGERSFTYWRGESPARELFALKDVELESQLLSFGLLYVSGITLGILSEDGRNRLVQLMSASKQSGARVVYDTNHRARLWESSKSAQMWNGKAIAASSALLPSLEDLGALFDETLSAAVWLDRLSNFGLEEIVIKDGPRPVHARTGGEDMLVAAQKITAPVDTTGAGDSFNAAYIASRLLGHDMRESIVRAHGLAACVIGHAGAIIPKSAMPALAQH